MPRWLGHAVSKTVTRPRRGGSTPLPSALAQSCHCVSEPPDLELVGSAPICVATPPSDNGSPPGSQPGSRGSVPRGGTGVDVRGPLPPMRSSSAVERVVVAHRRRGFDALLRSPGTVTEDSGTRLQPGPRWCDSSRCLHAVVAQWQSVSLPARRPRGRSPPTALRGQGVDRYMRGFHPRVMGGGTH